MPDGPALPRGGEVGRHQIDTDRDARLRPAAALIVRIQDVSALPDDDDAVARDGGAVQDPLRGERAHLRRRIEHVDVGCAPRTRRDEQGKRREQWCEMAHVHGVFPPA